MRAISKLLTYLIGCLLLASCSTLGPPTSSQLATKSWAKRQAQLLHLTAWTSIGAVGIKTPQAAWSASFNWQQQFSNYQLQLFAPLGMGSLSLTGNDKTVELITSKGERYQASTTQALLQERTGWYLPVELLRYWVLGIPAPQSPAKLIFDNQHRLSKLAQQGWLIEYQAYKTTGQFELPSLLVLQNDYFKIRISIKQWSL
ncbi:MAG: lolB [Gammaproteobacteria bacterium]|jgi:outer membrane lipoprotein LolB|nr:lolB [Gammaproteobacteria bacterium]